MLLLNTLLRGALAALLPQLLLVLLLLLWLESDTKMGNKHFSWLADEQGKGGAFGTPTSA